MAKQQIKLGEGKTTYFRPKEMTEGQKISGKYVGTLTDNYENLCHKLILENGETGIINGSGKLNALLERVASGTNIDVVFKGKSEIQSGKWKGTMAYDYDLFADELAATEGSEENVPF